MSNQEELSNGVTQDSVLCLILFTMFKYTKKLSTLSKFADDKKIGVVADTSEDKFRIQKDLEKWNNSPE